MSQSFLGDAIMGIDPNLNQLLAEQIGLSSHSVERCKAVRLL